MNSSSYIKKNRGTITIPRGFGKLLLVFFGVRIVLIIITQLTRATPFLCYDDFYTYDKITTLSSAKISSQIDFRNCYYMICMYLNRIRIGEYITGTRILNVILYFFLCFKIYRISKLLGYENKTCKTILIFMMISPYYVIYSMVPLREILCAFCVFYLFWAFLRFEKEQKINWITFIIIAALLYFVRVYILEVLLFFILLYKLKDSHWGIKILLLVIVGFSVIYLFSSKTYLYVLNDKMEHYVYNGITSTGVLSKIAVTGFNNVYNLVFLLPFVQLIPLPGAYDIYYTSNSWSAWITFFSGVAGFVLPYFWMHIYGVFRDKSKSLERVLALFYLAFVIIIAVAEPGNSRFFFFTTPVFYLFGVSEFILKFRKNPKNILFGCVCACIPYLYLLM